MLAIGLTVAPDTATSDRRRRHRLLGHTAVGCVDLRDAAVLGGHAGAERVKTSTDVAEVVDTLLRVVEQARCCTRS